MDNSSKTMHKMVVHKADGAVIKGISYNFSPLTSVFHLEPLEGQGFEAKAIEIRLVALKAIFFVRTFEGHPEYREKKTFQDEGIVLQQGRKATVEFNDGESIYGMIFTFDPKKTGFWLFPIDPNDNNEKIFVLSATVKNVKFL
jgi:hypothetical protein